MFLKVNEFSPYQSHFSLETLENLEYFMRRVKISYFLYWLLAIVMLPKYRQ